MNGSVLCLWLVLLGVVFTSALPYHYVIRPRRSPHRALMLSGYYGRPSVRRSGYAPEGSMTAFASGDTVATNSFMGGETYSPETADIEVPADENGQKEDELTPTGNPDTVPEETYQEEAEIAPTTVKPRRTPKRKQPKPQEDDDDDTEGLWPFMGMGGKTPSYNAFFPIMFGGYQGSKTRSGEALPGAPTAIANSFSTGRGGVANSHAVSLADPNLAAALLRSYNVKKKTYTQSEE